MKNNIIKMILTLFDIRVIFAIEQNKQGGVKYEY